MTGDSRSRDVRLSDKRCVYLLCEQHGIVVVIALLSFVFCTALN